MAITQERDKSFDQIIKHSVKTMKENSKCSIMDVFRRRCCHTLSPLIPGVPHSPLSPCAEIKVEILHRFELSPTKQKVTIYYCSKYLLSFVTWSSLRIINDKEVMSEQTIKKH